MLGIWVLSLIFCASNAVLLPEIPKQEFSILAKTAKGANNVRLLRGRVGNGHTDEPVVLLGK